MEAGGNSHSWPVSDHPHNENSEGADWTIQSFSKSTIMNEVDKDIVTVVENIVKKCEMGKTVSKCIEESMQTLGKLDEELSEVDAHVDNRHDASMNHNGYHNNKRAKLQSVVLEELVIGGEGTDKRRLNVDEESSKKLPISALETSGASKVVSTTNLINQNKQTSLRQPGFTSYNTGRKPGPASRTGYYSSNKLSDENKFVLLETPKIIQRPPPKAGDIIFALFGNLLTCWHKAVVIEDIFNQDTKQTEYVVARLSSRFNNPGTGGGDFDEDCLRVPQLCLKQLAYTIPCPFILPVGIRIIAKYKHEVVSEENDPDQYYAGIIAEHPRKENRRSRYLIFFDDGYAQYVSPECVFLICESSRCVWNDMYPDCYDFIKDYLKKYPCWPMVKLTVGQMVATEWNGIWLIARVMEVDNCLAKVRFDNDGRDEWIYRGSARFRPVTRQMVENQRNQCSVMNSEVAGASFHRLSSTTGICKMYDELLKFTRGRDIDFLDPSLRIEYQGTLRKIKLDNNSIPKEYIPHDCGPSCLRLNNMPSGQRSPLSVPFMLEFRREVCREPRHSVFYRGPCGIRLRNDEELANYLDWTNSNLTQDYFSFDYDVDCLSEFIPARVLGDISDISFGKERAPVQAVNSFDYDPPPSVTYITHRIPGPGVTINLDEDFLICCDCENNCRDPESCPCLQLTQEGISLQVSNDDGEIPLQGYENRRLKTKVISGIYECNSRCKCKKTCGNRTVQNGAFWPLQLFKTHNKGWAIRTVYDMPLGTFVCVYAGEVLNDRTAEAVGLQVGDEYFAQLDYIEMCERYKPDYESDVTDIEAVSSSLSDDDSHDKELITKNQKKTRKARQISSSESERESRSGNEADLDNSHSENSSISLRRQLSKLKPSGTTARKSSKQARQTIHNQSSIPSPSPQRKRTDARCQLYGPSEECYILDARITGNVGRFLNHSCTPNVIAQNVFVETQDMRFPHIALFTNQLVKAGSELTWDYCYTLSSDKIIYCLCNTRDCRGRLM